VYWSAYIHIALSIHHKGVKYSLSPTAFLRTLCRGHSIQLCAVQGRNPFYSLRSEQFSIWFRVVDDVEVIQDTRFNDPHAVDTAERLPMPEKRRPTVWTEVVGNFFAAVGNLADLFWCT